MASSAITWSIGQGKPGMELVDKWETEGKLTEANQKQHKPIFQAVWRTHLTKV